MESLLKLDVDGILISISKTTSDFSFFEEIQHQGTPIVFFDRIPDLKYSNSVLLDDYQGGKIATIHLIENGCKNLVYVVGDQNTSIFKRRKEGFLSAIYNNKDRIQNHYLVELSLKLKEDIKLLKHLFKQNPLIDGFFCHGDKHGVYALNILRALSYNVPEQIKLIGFGNNDYGAFTYPQMSSIDQKGNEMGSLAVEILLT